MHINEYVSEISSRLAVRTLFVWVLLASVIVNIILSLCVTFKDTNQKIVVLPAEPTKSFWLDDKTVSADYLEQMGVFVMQLALNNSPETLEFNTKKLLKYVAPEHRGETELSLLTQARKMKANNASAVFLPQSVQIKEQSLTVAVSGNFKQFIGNSKTSEVKRCWAVQFYYEAGRLWVKNLYETNCKKPFEKLSEEA